MLDPLIFRLIAIAFALLLITAGLHKIGDRLRFQGILRGYQILPEHLIAPVSMTIPVVETLLGLAWAFAWQIDLVSVATAALLTAYGMAMGINLMRGRSYIDCGCGFSSLKASQNDSGVQQLSKWLVVRNLVLMVLATIASADVSDRSMGVLDYFSLVAALLALIFLYAAFNQLLVNNNAIDSWRKPLLKKIEVEVSHD